MCVALLAIFASPAMAQAGSGGFSMNLGAAVRCWHRHSRVPALGIGRIGGQAVEGMSRQPEAAGNIQTAMIIAAALIEGATFFALIVACCSKANRDVEVAYGPIAGFVLKAIEGEQ